MGFISSDSDPNICRCCGASMTSDLRCVCTAFNDWHMTENGEVACGYHKADLYLKPERTTVALGVKPIESNDRFRNFR